MSELPDVAEDNKWPIPYIPSFYYEWHVEHQSNISNAVLLYVLTYIPIK
jgi:hypothetical protein